mmetsp:Transcript_5647/g.14027  ORF Transcript_5647/g.14027 Transcript_5647/m.14027 type:complete len:254 (-) Transcript_5647:231-992(-)
MRVALAQRGDQPRTPTPRVRLHCHLVNRHHGEPCVGGQAHQAVGHLGQDGGAQRHVAEVLPKVERHAIYHHQSYPVLRHILWQHLQHRQELGDLMAPEQMNALHHAVHGKRRERSPHRGVLGVCTRDDAQVRHCGLRHVLRALGHEASFGVDVHRRAVVPSEVDRDLHRRAQLDAHLRLADPRAAAQLSDFPHGHPAAEEVVQILTEGVDGELRRLLLKELGRGLGPRQGGAFHPEANHLHHLARFLVGQPSL